MKENNEFYIVEKYYSKKFVSVVVAGYESETWECPKCGGIFLNQKSDLLVYFKGKYKLPDYCSTSGYSMASSKLEKVLIENNVSGISFRNLNIEGWYDSKEKVLGDISGQYKELEVSGRCGLLRDRNGSIVKKCDVCDKIDYSKASEVDGLSINLDEWDGSDIFYFKNWKGVIIVTDKVKRILEENNISNINFINIKDFKYD